MSPQEIAAAIEWSDRWEGRTASDIAEAMERDAAIWEARAANSPYKGGKRKAANVAEAKRLRALAEQFRAAALS